MHKIHKNTHAETAAGCLFTKMTATVILIAASIKRSEVSSLSGDILSKGLMSYQMYTIFRISCYI